MFWVRVADSTSPAEIHSGSVMTTPFGVPGFDAATCGSRRPAGSNRAPRWGQPGRIGRRAADGPGGQRIPQVGPSVSGPKSPL